MFHFPSFDDITGFFIQYHIYFTGGIGSKCHVYDNIGRLVCSNRVFHYRTKLDEIYVIN